MMHIIGGVISFIFCVTGLMAIVLGQKKFYSHLMFINAITAIWVVLTGIGVAINNIYTGSIAKSCVMLTVYLVFIVLTELFLYRAMEPRKMLAETQ
jgi:hypothetical protein